MTSVIHSQLEGPIAQNIQTLFDDTGIQQALIDPILGLLGSVGGMFTS